VARFSFVSRPARVALAFVAALVVAVVPASAQAALLPGLLPGVLAPADTAQSCTASAQVFAPWGDYAYYMLMPGGTFEPGGHAWSLSSGARVVPVNEPFYVNAAGDSNSLYLPAGARATTPSMCYGGDMGKLRFFAKGTGTLRVQAIVKSATGGLLGGLNALLVDAGRIEGTGAWAPSREVGLLLNQLGGLLVTDSISFRFVAESGSWLIDDAYLDPAYQW
jgi:hypothetical protein